jgi:hypothetical protein
MANGRIGPLLLLAAILGFAQPPPIQWRPGPAVLQLSGGLKQHVPSQWVYLQGREIQPFLKSIVNTLRYSPEEAVVADKDHQWYAILSFLPAVRESELAQNTRDEQGREVFIFSRASKKGLHLVVVAPRENETKARAAADTIMEGLEAESIWSWKTGVALMLLAALVWWMVRRLVS